ncbi:unnamed protein product [Lepeophtheirus salmonis]|uniref:(salmon louse) hypothetical protein n=1 Tax=Lepeophtheirus salmonis TaxID=72036 RepID=A0A7R8D4L0_LEPSM|nr:unnamed protein product [Lepeophtheirus salmonis]CAF2995623.1 unnamed protein product [Lepeophtheirus salmonis]
MDVKLKRKATKTAVRHFSSTSNNSEEKEMSTTSSKTTPNTSHIAAYAVFNDLSLMEKIKSYNDKKISAVVTTVFSRHLWYLSGQLQNFSKRGSDNPLHVGGDSLRT